MHPTLNHNHNLNIFNFSALHLIYTVSTKQTTEWYNKSFGQGSRIIYDSLTYYVECLWTKFWASLILPEKSNRLLLNIYIINNMSLETVLHNGKFVITILKIVTSAIDGY